MSNIHIPPQSTRRWTGPYLGSFYGTLWKTFNVDLDREEGKIALSRRLTKLTVQNDSSSDTLGNIETFLRADADCTDRWWGLSRGGSGNALYRSTDSDPTGTWRQDTTANSPTSARDMTTFEKDSTGDTGRQQIFVTTDTDIVVLNDTGNRAWATGWWVTTQSHASDSALQPGIPHPIEYFPFRRIALVGDGKRVHTISRTSDSANETTTTSRLVLPTRLQCEHIFYTATRVWILCSDVQGGNGAIVEWDGFSQSPNGIHDGYAPTVYSGINFRGIPIVVNSRGVILEYTGNGFSPMVRNGQKIALPLSEELGVVLSSIKPRGMTMGNDGLIYINVRQAASPNSFRQVSGIWCLDPVGGRLYNKHALGEWGSTDFGQQRTADNGAIYALPAGLTDQSLIVGGASFNPATTTKYAIWILESPTSITATRGYFITQYIPASEIRDFWDVLWARFKRFVTSANRIVIKGRGVRPLVNSTGAPLQATITWASTASLTVTLSASDDALAVGDEIEVMTGDNAGMLAHITAISGAHAALQTITLDEIAPVNSVATAVARFDRWKKLGTISSTTKYEDSVPIGISGSFVQFKVEMRGPAREMEIESLIATFKPDLIAQN